MGVTSSDGTVWPWLRRDEKTAAKVSEILGLAKDRWTDIRVEFQTDEVPVAVVTFLLTGGQLTALAELAVSTS